MKLHANARLSVKGRELLIARVEDARWSVMQAAEAAGITERTAHKWLARYRAEGAPGLLDRSSAPLRVANRTEERRVEAIAALRRLRMTGAEIGEVLGMALSTVSGILSQIGMGKLGRLGLEPAQRYERQVPGELIHIDVKKLGRIHQGAGHRVHGKRGRYNPQRTDAEGRVRKTVGWEFVHIAIDDATRLAYVEVLSDERRSQRSRSLPEPWRTTRATGSRCSSSSPTTAAPTAQACTRSPAALWVSATCAHAPTARRPTARFVS
jgi:transposase